MLKATILSLIGALVMTIVAGDVDTEGPQFVSLEVQPETVNVAAGDALPIFSVHVTDDLSGVDSIQIFFDSEEGKSYDAVRMSSGNLLSGTVQDGIFESTWAVARFSAPDVLSIRSIVLHDMVGNLTRLTGDEVKDIGVKLSITNTIESSYIPVVINGQ